MSRTILPAVLAALAVLGSVGCAGAHSGVSAVGAPSLAEETATGLPMRHNLADPNAPFAVLSSAPHLTTREPLLDVSAAPVCDPGQLRIWESRASANGTHRSIRYTLANTGSACKLAGFPAVTLEGPAGEILGSIEFQKVSDAAIAASLRPGDANPRMIAVDTAPSAPVLLIPRGQAGFDLGWTSGPSCQEVAKIVIAAPGSDESVIIPRQLSVCESRVLISAVSPNDRQD